MSCPVKIRPFPNSTELRCERAAGNHDEHYNVLRDYAFPGSETKMTWQDSDRRCFTGEWVECAEQGCVLPNGHRGNHES